MAPIQQPQPQDFVTFLRDVKTRPIDVSVNSLVSLFRRRAIKKPKPCAIATIYLLREVVSKAACKDVEGLFTIVRRHGQRLMEAQPHELVIPNMVRRVLYLIRTEVKENRNENEFGTDSIPDLQSLQSLQSIPDATTVTATTKEPKGPPLLARAPTSAQHVSILSLLSSPLDEPADRSGTGSPMGRSGTSTPLFPGQSTNMPALRREIIDGMDEIIDEIDQVDDQIAGYADTQIRPSCHILVYEPDSTTERFLLKAAQRRKFTAIVVRGFGDPAESKNSTFCKKLQSAGVTVIKAANCGITAYISTVDKVILSALAATADGGVMAQSGAATVARAAHEHCKPVIVLMGIYKLGPDNPSDVTSLVEWEESEGHVAYGSGVTIEKMKVQVPLTEFVPPTMVGTYISNLGVHSADHLHGLVSDHYDEEDTDFHLAVSGQ